jgi:ribosomal protein S18 acetylase RimI-like enzyme
MTSLHSRAFSKPEDLQAMTALLRRLRDAGQVVYPIATDLHEELDDPAARASVRLWEDEQGEMLGFCYVSTWQNLVDAFQEAAFSHQVEREMMDCALNTVRERNRTSGKNDKLDASVLESDTFKRVLLERNGFTLQEESSLLLARRLDNFLPQPNLPPGFTIRPMAGDTELEAYVALHRAAFGTENMTLEYRRSIMHAPDYLPELDLVAVAPDGRLAAFCVCQIFPDDSPRAGGTREGWTDPLGTHPDFQRKGLAQALMLAGMHLLKARDVDTVLLGTSSTNIPMQRTAAALGFQKVSNTLWYSRQVV